MTYPLFAAHFEPYPVKLPASECLNALSYCHAIVSECTALLLLLRYNSQFIFLIYSYVRCLDRKYTDWIFGMWTPNIETRPRQSQAASTTKKNPCVFLYRCFLTATANKRVWASHTQSRPNWIFYHTCPLTLIPLPHKKAFISTPAMCRDTFVASLTDQNISQVYETCRVWRRTNQRLGRKYLSFSPCEGCGSSLLPRRALVYFQWCRFQASNHIIKALHHIYSSSKVPDSLQLFPTPAAKP